MEPSEYNPEDISVGNQVWLKSDVAGALPMTVLALNTQFAGGLSSSDFDSPFAPTATCHRLANGKQPEIRTYPLHTITMTEPTDPSIGEMQKE